MIHFIELQCAVQHYAWGDRDFISKLLGTNNTEGKPFAELWIGAHPDAPSQALLEGPVPLNRLIESDPEGILHPDVAARFDQQLPFLMKVLAAAAPLSLQIHPGKAAAEEGFAREERDGLPLEAKHRNYRDRNHKPELIVALTDFYALSGFRPLSDIMRALNTTPELADWAVAFGADGASLLEVYSQFMTSPQDKVDGVLRPLVRRLSVENQREAFTKSDREYWLLRADLDYSRDGHHDRGLFSVYLLNLVHLRPFEGMYLPAGVLHAYLEGAGVEIMANSNNVLRGGWTVKHVDVPELLRNVTVESRPAEIITAEPAEGNAELKYPVRADEFELSCIELDECRRHTCAKDHSVEVFLVAAASPGTRVTLRTDGAEGTFRRGAAFLVTAGTKYELNANGHVTLFKAAVPLRRLAQPVGFRGRQTTELAFGTSGLRGLVTNITDLEAYINTRGFLDYLFQINDVRRGDTLNVACDLRPSSDGPERSILRAVAQAIVEAGLAVDNLGPLPTPALTYYAMQQGRASIMVTGSHIPFDRNGIKFNKSTGEVLKADESPILQAVSRVREIEYSRTDSNSAFDDDGMFKRGRRMSSPLVNSQGLDVYMRRYLDFFPGNALQGQRIVFYEHSAVGRDLLVQLLTALGAHVVPMGRSQSFIPLDTEAISADKLRLLQELADEARRNHGYIDAIVSTDGDSDRPLLAGITTDGQVMFFGGDILGILAAEFLNADAVLTPISVNDAVDRWAASQSISVRKTRIGSPYVIEAMQQAKNEGYQRTVGWEANGGFLIGSDIQRCSRWLRALPTRDAALPLLAVLSLANEQRTSVVDLFQRLPRRFSKAGLLDHFANDIGRALVQHFTSEKTQRKLETFFTPGDGFGGIRSIDVLDGIRIYFDNDDIAHIRPSGNAPQLRVYAVADNAARADQIVELALREPDGILRKLESAVLQEMTSARLVQRIQSNIALSARLFSAGETPEIIGTVCGSQPAQEFWQALLDQAKSSFGARKALSFHEDLPTNQAFGLLLLWQRLKPSIQQNCGSLVAFVFGDGTRSTPFTETDNGQKPAMATFVSASGEHRPGFIPMVELAMKYFVPVQQYLRRSGFNGLVVKWGDEVQIPTLDLSSANDLFREADIVRFVSLREIQADESRNKDWVGVDGDGRVIAFIPRRPLEQMQALAERGLIQYRNGKLFGGINLGSIAVSYAFLDCLLEEFHSEVNDVTADRKLRPALDPEFFTAVTVAMIEDSTARAEAWQLAIHESSAVDELNTRLPGMIHRLRRCIDVLERRYRRGFKMVAMDFGDQYWGDIGQHPKIYDFFMALNDSGAVGQISRALAGLPETRDAGGNLVVNSSISPNIRVKNSVLVNVRLCGEGDVDGCVLIGTRARNVNLVQSFDVLSTVTELHAEARAGTYKVVSATPIHAARGERLTTLFLPEIGPRLFRVDEDTDLGDRARTYSVPILGNLRSFQDAHNQMVGVPVSVLSEDRRRAESAVCALVENQ